MVTVKVVRNDGKEFLIDNVMWKITSDGLDGWDMTGFSVSTENKAFGDGSVEKSERVPEKDRTVKAILTNKSLSTIMRQVVRRFFNPHHTYKVYLTYQDVTKWCEGRLNRFSLPTENIHDTLELQFTILCTQPYLLSVDDYSQNIAEVMPMFSFPFSVEIGEKFTFSEYNFAKEVLIENDGDIDTFMKVVIETRGEATNPIIKKDDKFIKILDSLVFGDVIVIDLISQPIKITKNGENIIRLIDRDSSFTDIKLNVGDNVVSYDSETGSQNIDVTIYFNKRYTGM